MSERDDALIRAEGVEKRYSTASGFLERLFRTGETVPAVDGVDLAVRSGETLGVVGESGCGKTTLGQVLVGLVEPTAGTVTYRDIDVTAPSRVERRTLRQDVQYVFQNPTASLDPRLPVDDLVREPLAVHDVVPGRRRGDRVGELLEIVGLDRSHAGRYPDELSGGQRQRVAIARALAVEPELLVLDEPVSALDAAEQARVLNLLADLQAAFELSYLFISHDLAVVEHVSDRIAVMYLGRIVERGPTGTLFDGDVHPYTEALLSAIPEPDPRWQGERIILEGDVPSPTDPPSGCRFHTRCPKVIPPTALDLEPETFRGVMRLRSRLERIEDADDFRESVHTSSTDAGEKAISTAIRERDAIPSTLRDSSAEEALSAALESIAAGDLEAARGRLASTFETPCESEEPALRPSTGSTSRGVPDRNDCRRDETGETHLVACHRFDDEFDDRSGKRPNSEASK
ncbi:ATP-binding cassette domain-containing protein [Natrarchaeobius halalkaliphilus]|uniref:ATP-binding cassette domain-containing protein n=1 Tax=Natrarchaeobius halalkaliphilus TaxID=1679091 RepID=A0A3N6P9E8_9EURY|nr:oligopeptide/dipeptide ABC transporter ATP-binding protein [Natrarchaeobius halalkaliphilus]RQG92855.1 ATP-binding cassette domain-containing protein [Natrarchaeobius halalkaliphilus]